MRLLKSWTRALKTCDEDIAFFLFSFPTIANLYMLPRPMLFPTTPMISVSTNKIKKYTLFCYFKSEASSWFWFPETKIKIYFIIILIIFLLQIKSKSMSSVFTNKNKNMLHFFTKFMFSVSTNRNKNILYFLLQIKTKWQADLIKPHSFLWKSIISLVSLKWNFLMLLTSWLGRV